MGLRYFLIKKESEKATPFGSILLKQGKRRHKPCYSGGISTLVVRMIRESNIWWILPVSSSIHNLNKSPLFMCNIITWHYCPPLLPAFCLMVLGLQYTNLFTFVFVSFDLQVMEEQPFEQVIANTTPSAIALLRGMLVLNPSKRFSATYALLQPYFFTEPLPVMHTWLFLHAPIMTCTVSNFNILSSSMCLIFNKFRFLWIL